MTFLQLFPRCKKPPPEGNHENFTPSKSEIHNYLFHGAYAICTEAQPEPTSFIPNQTAQFQEKNYHSYCNSVVSLEIRDPMSGVEV